MKLYREKAMVIILLLGALNGCTALVSDSMLRDAHQDMDKNHDGYIDYAEYLKNSSDKDTIKEAKDKGMTKEEYLKWDFNRADKNGDGKVTAQEMIDLFRKDN